MNTKQFSIKPESVKQSLLLSYDFFYLLDHFFSRSAVNFLFGKLRTTIRQRHLAGLRQKKGKTIAVDRRENLSSHDFIENYLKPGIPVVLAGAAKHWPCVEKWNFDYLASVCSKDAVTLLPKERTTSGFQGTREQEEVEQTSFESFISELKLGSGKYLRFSTMVEDHDELLKDINPSWLEKYFGNFKLGHRIHSFIGSEGSRTRLHSDFPPNLFTQIYGKKQWILYPPEYRVFIDPLLERSSLSFTTNLEVRDPLRAEDCISHHFDRYETILEPGDVLFNPAYMWHDVVNLTDSIGVSVRWLTLGVHWRASIVQQILNLFAINPSIFGAGLSKRDINKNLLKSKNAAKKDSSYIG